MTEGGGSGAQWKSRFPVARIKKIMQADEDVGKVAQVTPVAICKNPLHPRTIF
jgi:Dr1-associated corepressor